MFKKLNIKLELLRSAEYMAIFAGGILNGEGFGWQVWLPVGAILPAVFKHFADAIESKSARVVEYKWRDNI